MIFIHAHDPQRSIDVDQKIVSKAAVLFVGGISQFSLPTPILPVRKFATKPK
jgi:hypothetical protein